MEAGSLLDFVTQCFPFDITSGLNSTDGLDEDIFLDLTIDDFPLLLRRANVSEDQIGTFTSLIPTLLDQCVGFSASDSFTISGMETTSSWRVPLIKCDASRCKSAYESAEEYCERNIVGIAGDPDRMAAFLTWVESEYPVEKDLQLFRVFDTPGDMDAYVENHFYGRSNGEVHYQKLAMGIVFDAPIHDKPSVWGYQLRPNSTNVNEVAFSEETGEGLLAIQSMPNTGRLTDTYAKTEDEACGTANSVSCAAQYGDNGVLTFQRLVHDFILNQTATSSRVSSVAFVPFPTRPYEEGLFFQFVSGMIIKVTPQAKLTVLLLPGFLSLMVTLGLLYPVASMTSYVVKEKMFRQKELMKMMSVTEADIGWSWFATFFFFHCFTGTMAAFLSTFIFKEASPVLLLIFWICSMISVITFSLTIASFCSKSTRAVLFAVLGFFAGFFLTFVQNVERGRRSLVLLVSVHPVAAFAYGVGQISRLEERGVGLTVRSMGFSDTNSGYTFVDTLTMLLVDSVFWGSISWYLNRVVRPEYGHAHPFYFPFQYSYWFPSAAASHNEHEAAAAANSDIPYEKVDEALARQSVEKKTIEIHNIRKCFGDKIAVDGLSLTMYSGHITALLGHNGKGVSDVHGFFSRLVDQVLEKQR